MSRFLSKISGGMGESLWSLDANKSELTRFGCDLSGDSLFRQEAVNLDKDILRALDFVMMDDSTFIIPDYSGDNRFLLGEQARRTVV